jgi:hypothetical protein
MHRNHFAFAHFLIIMDRYLHVQSGVSSAAGNFRSQIKAIGAATCRSRTGMGLANVPIV